MSFVDDVGLDAGGARHAHETVALVRSRVPVEGYDGNAQPGTRAFRAAQPAAEADETFGWPGKRGRLHQRENSHGRQCIHRVGCTIRLLRFGFQAYTSRASIVSYLLVRPPSVLSSSIGNARLALQVRRRASSPALRQALTKVEALAHSAPVVQLRQRVEPMYQREPTSAAKYATPRQWILVNALRAAALGLDTGSALRVLDIGCGPAYFLAIGRALGHQCYGVDAPETILTPLERDVYATLVQAFQCGEVVSPLLIERFKPLPFREQPFDLITAYLICFNRHRQPDEWGREEWRFFVEDAMTCLRRGGRLVLDLNENAERYGPLRFYDEATRDYFRSVGIVDQGKVAVLRP